MVMPWRGRAGFKDIGPFVLERLYWRGYPLPLVKVHLRWLSTRRDLGYPYPGKRLRDAFGKESDELEPKREAAA